MKTLVYKNLCDFACQFLGMEYPEEFPQIVVWHEDIMRYDYDLDCYRITTQSLQDYINRYEDLKNRYIVNWIAPSGEIYLNELY